ncbi:hypothetical protein K504DRAFT_466989, partial [Pleomassaria siparia CBS 279.74]
MLYLPILSLVLLQGACAVPFGRPSNVLNSKSLSTAKPALSTLIQHYLVIPINPPNMDETDDIEYNLAYLLGDDNVTRRLSPEDQLLNWEIEVDDMTTLEEIFNLPGVLIVRPYGAPQVGKAFLQQNRRGGFH